MSGDWDDAQEAMNNLRARISELEAELEASQECELDVNRAMCKRLAAVIALCSTIEAGAPWRDQVSRAATGDTNG